MASFAPKKAKRRNVKNQKDFHRKDDDDDESLKMVLQSKSQCSAVVSAHSANSILVIWCFILFVI